MTFIENKYTYTYAAIINRAKCDPHRTKVGSIYYEKHHILPRSMGGSNKKENLVLLTAKEHYLCHLLLVKMVTGRDRFKMGKAVVMMQRACSHSSRYSAAKFERDRSWVVARGADHPFFGKRGAETNRFGIPHTQQTKAEMSASRKGRMTGADNCQFGKKRTEDEKLHLSQKMSGVNNPFYGKKHIGEFAERNRGETHAMYGKTHSEATRKKISEAVSRTQTGTRNHRFGVVPSDDEKEAQAARMRGRRWINDGYTQRFVDSITASNLLDDGWLLGRIK